MAVLTLAAVLACGCEDGTLQPIQAGSSSAGGQAQGGTGSTAGTSPWGISGGATSWSTIGGTAGSGGTEPSNDTAYCAMSDWPDAGLEDEMLAVLNARRKAGTACAGSVGVLSAPLSDSADLRCAARVHSATSLDILTTPVTEVRLFSEPPEMVDVSNLVQQVVDGGGVDCENLLSAEFSFVGIGFATDGFWGYWTIYLANS